MVEMVLVQKRKPLPHKDVTQTTMQMTILGATNTGNTRDITLLL